MVDGFPKSIPCPIPPAMGSWGGGGKFQIKNIRNRLGTKPTFLHGIY